MSIITDPNVARLVAEGAAYWQSRTPEQRQRHMKPARAAIEQHLEDLVDPDRKLDPNERARRVDLKRRQQLAAMSARAAEQRTAAAQERRRRKIDDELDVLLGEMAGFFADLAKVNA